MAVSLIDINWDPSRRQLRQFGVCALPAAGLLGWTLTAGLDWPDRQPWLLAAGGVGTAFAAVGLARPTALKWPFLALTLVTLPIGLVVSEVILLALFFLVFTPMAVVLRLLGRDALNRRWDPALASYWEPRPAETDPARYLRQF